MPDRGPIFANRLQAAAFLAGLAGFWGGFLVLAAMLLSRDPHLGRHAQPGPAEIAAVLLMGGSGIVLTVVQLLLARRIGSGGMGMWSYRMVMPGTLAAAARTLGLNGPVTAGALYAVLVLGLVAFFSAFVLH